jgi:pyruvate/2-oxoglutarate dehydrogenase complex dihydrolipoamide acyltransferase (E2) component
VYLLKRPKADENMAEGTVVRWLVAEGDEVARDEDCCECVADKGEFMVYAEEPGVVRRVFAPEQSVVPVGYVLAAIGSAEENLPEVEPQNARLMARARERLSASEGLRERAQGSERVRATPAARRLARELGIELGEVSAALGGRLVREEDVREFSRGRSPGRPQQDGPGRGEGPGE